jgi:hypothetical protein
MGMTVDTLVRLADALELDPGDVLNGAIGQAQQCCSDGAREASAPPGSCGTSLGEV